MRRRGQATLASSWIWALGLEARRRAGMGWLRVVVLRIGLMGVGWICLMGFSLGMGMGMLGVVVETGIEGMIIGDGCGLVLLLSRIVVELVLCAFFAQQGFVAMRS